MMVVVSTYKPFVLSFKQVLLISLFALGMVSGVQGAERLIELDNQVISGTGLIGEADDSPIRTEVISAKQLEFMQAKVLTDALQYSSGLKVQRTVKQGSKVSMQGIDANYVLVLKDGLPFIAPTGSETDLSQISLAGIERIEIIKGSGSALYGSSAMGGVINLISKESEVSQIELDLQQGIYAQGAEEGLQQHSLFASQLLGQQKLSLQAFFKDSPEIDLNKQTQAADGAQQSLKNLELRLDHHHGKGYFTNANSMSYVRLNYMSDEKLKAKNPIIYPGQGAFASDYKTDSDKTSLDAGVRQLSSPLFDQGALMMRYEHFSEQSGNRDTLSIDKNQRTVDTQLFKFESQFNNQLQIARQLHSISYGLSYQQNTMEQNKIGGDITEIDNKSSTTVELYIQDDVITQSWGEFVPGLRVQNDSDFGFHSNAKMNWMKELSSYHDIFTKFRISYGQGYRTPDLKQRFYKFDHSNIGYVINGNENLKPEESHNINATYTMSHFDNRLEFSAYFNDYKNKIETVYSGQVDGISQNNYQNVGRAITQGYDISLTLQPTSNFYWQQSLAYLATKNLDTGERLESQPLWSYKTQFNYSFNHKLVLSLYGNLELDSYKGKFDSDKDDVVDSIRATTQNLIQIWDTRASFRINSYLQLTAGIDNLLNETRDVTIDPDAEVDDRPIESRLMTLGLKLTY